VRPIDRDDLAAPPSVFLLAEAMMSLDPSARYQTLTQLLDAIGAARGDLGGAPNHGGATEALSSPPTVFVVEKNDRLMDELRAGFRSLGYRVLITRDPALALQRFRQQPYEALVVDAATTKTEGREAFDRVLTEVGRRDVPFAGVLLLSERQADSRPSLPAGDRATSMTLPTNVKAIHRSIRRLLADPGSAA
jgi:CheY-like chemotaxis protein